MLDVMAFSLVGEPQTATEERAMSERSISLEWRHHHRINKGGLVKEHTAVALQSVLADFERVLAVLVGDAARTTHNSGYLWRGLGGCGDEEDVSSMFKLYVIKRALTSCTSRSLVFRLLNFVDNSSIFVVIFRMDGAPVVGTSTALGDGGIHAIAGL
jgi:hypothetical protein